MVKKIITEYIPINEQETIDKKAILDFIEKNDDYLDRNNLIAHLTTSAIVVNEDLTKVLFAYHLIYKSWSWLGGHNDNDPDCLNVAVKEAKEESGLERIEVLNSKPIMIDIINVTNHIKNKKYVPDHLHLNLTYLLRASEKDTLKIKEDENSGVKWIKLEDILKEAEEERMIPIYTKAINYIKNFLK